jgi:Na+-driven multidrug efflux pump
MDPLLLVVWIIAAIALAAILGFTGIAVAIDVIIARRLGYPRRRAVVAALLSFLVLSVGFAAVVFVVLHWAAPSTN